MFGRCGGKRCSQAAEAVLSRAETSYHTAVAMSSIAETCVELLDRMKVVTEQRLVFDKTMRARAIKSAKESPKPADAPDNLEQIGVLSVEGRVTYMKLKGDQLLHLAELAHCNGWSITEQDGVAAEALEAYLDAQLAASNGGSTRTSTSTTRSSSVASALPELHPLRLELALRVSSVLLHMLRRPVEAWEAAYPTYLAAAERPARLGPRGLAITQLLRDHLAVIDVGGERSSSEDAYEHASKACGPAEEDGAWSFLRMSNELNQYQVGTPATAKLRAISQVKRARACMAGVAKVLLGTMENAETVQSSLKQIFFVYVKNHATTPLTCDDGKRVWVQGRPVPLQEFSRHGPFLSWSGFEAVCSDFNIAVGIPSRKPSSARTPRDLSSQRPADPQPSKAAPAETRYWESAEGFLLSAAQTLVAFVSASTHGTVVASFPEGGQNAPQVVGAVGELHASKSRAKEEEKLWQDMERTVLFRSAPKATGVNFRQFVDALARCGLVGFVGSGNCDVQRRVNTGAVADARSRTGILMSVAERAQAVFISQMRLLDKEHVDATLRAGDAELKTLMVAR